MTRPPLGTRARRLREDLVLLSFPLPSGAPLTDAEVSLLQHLLAGESNREIARVRGTSTRTVANQVATLLRKFRAESRADLAARWLEILSR